MQGKMFVTAKGAILQFHDTHRGGTRTPTPIFIHL